VKKCVIATATQKAQKDRFFSVKNLDNFKILVISMTVQLEYGACAVF
jgi:hypothetical protein